MTDPETKNRRPRSSVFLTGETRLGGTTEKVRIRNLSESGAMIESASLSPATGASGRLVREGKDMPFLVRWRQANRYGIEFVQPVNEQELLPRGITRSQTIEKPTPFRRPGLRENAR